MNGLLRAIFAIPRAYLKLSASKILHPLKIKFGPLPRIDSGTEITLQGVTKIGKRWNVRKNSTIRCRKNAILEVGANVSFGQNNVIVTHKKITIGDNCQFGPNVMIFDHDHDFKSQGGLKDNYYESSSISIGKNVWIGASCVILRGTVIGDNCVIGAGSIIKGNYPSNSIIVQKKETTTINYK